MTKRVAGDTAELIELGDVTAAELHAAAARMRAEPNVLACIVGHSSLYVIRGTRSDATTATTREPREWHVPIVFDGEDLLELLARVSRDEFLARIPTLRLTARYLGFRGGWAYLDGWPEEWSMPRRPTSRPVARGTFAIAGNVAGFYPIDTPGGWNLLGRTDVDLENAFIPGDVVRMELVTTFSPRARGEKVREARMRGAELIQSPLSTLISPHPDYSRLERGLSAGGPFDDIAAACAISAVEGDVELLECAMVGPRIRFHRDAVIAWCTSDLALRVEKVRAGEERAFGRISGGLRAYLAIGWRLAVGSWQEQDRENRLIVHAIRGPHDVGGIGDVECEVTPQLDRVGIRLRPLQPLQIAIPADLKSIGMQCGTVQLHPDGSLVAMGPDHPVTGGYLQPMTVMASERWKLAQLQPGERVVLRAHDPY